MAGTPKSTSLNSSTGMPTEDPTHLPKGKVLNVPCEAGGDTGLAMAKVVAGPRYASAVVIDSLTGKHFGEEYSLMAVIETLKVHGEAVNNGDMRDVEDILTSQAIALNLLHAELTRRAFGNFGEYLKAGEQYLRLALKAQNQCRMTLETLSTIKNPPVVYAKQANINNGGQQQVNNGAEPPRASNSENAPNRLLEQTQNRPTKTDAVESKGSSECERPSKVPAVVRGSVVP